jgi:hypothetical protein
MSHPGLVAALILLATTLVALRSASAPWAAAAHRALGARATPWVLGIITALCLAWVAGATLDVEPISTDEASYLLQAEIFARGRMTAPPPPIQEFFEQPWVVVSPRIFSKYPPGHALALAPGVALGLPWLMPLLLNAVSGALLFIILRRAIGPGAALLTWAAWVLSVMTMSWQTSYFSEVTSLACWLAMIAAIDRWQEGGHPRWLVLAGVLAGDGAITRPLTMLLLALPFGVVVAQAARRQRRGRDVVAAAAAGMAVVLLLPAWNLGTTGSITRSPLREYTETYIPWDRLGFAIESTAARRPTPPDLQAAAAQLARIHREHTLAALPHTLGLRAWWVGKLTFTGWRVLLIALAVVGVWRLRGPGWVLLAAGISQFLGHAVWGHEAGWTIYYAESAAVWFIPGAVGAVALGEWLMRRSRVRGDITARVELALLLALPLLLGLSVQESGPYRAWRSARAGESRGFAEMLESGPTPAVYFVRHGATRSGRPGLVRNDPFLATAPVWVVYDLGPRNAELLRSAPARQAFLVDPDTRTVIPLLHPR